MARSVVENLSLLYRLLKIVPKRTSIDAELLRPEPLKTLELTFALKPPMFPLRFTIAAATPLIRDAVVPNIFSSTPRSERSTSIGLYPSLLKTTLLSLVGWTAAMVSRSMDPAMTFPRLWSVWFPPSSVLPAVEKTARAFFPKSS